MIGRRETIIAGERRIRYIALRLEERDNPVWSPSSGDVECTGDESLTAAVRTCIRSLDERFTLVLDDIAALQANRRVDAPQSEETDLRLDLRNIEEQVYRLKIEVARLLDEPTGDDSVRIAVDLAPVRLRSSQLRAARRLAGLGLRELSALSGRAVPTIHAIESGMTRSPYAATIESLVAVLTDAGVEIDSAGWVRYRETDHTASLATQRRLVASPSSSQ